MSDCISDMVYLSEVPSFNKIEYREKAEKAKINRFLRSKAKSAWETEKNLEILESALWEPPFDFTLYPAIPKRTVPFDPDAFMLISKRFIDGARDAGIIGDDNPKWIDSITIVSAEEINFAIPQRRAVFFAVLSPVVRPNPKRVYGYEV